MSNTKIDANDKPTWSAYNETTGLIEPVRVDSIFGAVLVFNTANTGGATGTVPNAKIDANDNATLIGYDETTGTIEALRCDTSGNLLTILQ